jgi:hypothetical protein
MITVQREPRQRAFLASAIYTTFQASTSFNEMHALCDETR